MDKEGSIAGEVNKIIIISLSMIFIAHAAITEANKQYMKIHQGSAVSHLSQKDQIKHVLQMIQPRNALKQIAEVLFLVSDRITSVPNSWLEALLPILAWLTLHREDSLVSTLFESYPQVPKDLARIHKILSNYCSIELKNIKDPEEHLKIVSLMGNTFLPEEFYFIGFLPLQTYVDTKKTIKNAQKCVAEREELVRALILKDLLEDLKCTMDQVKHVEQQEEQKEKVEDIFALIDNSALPIVKSIDKKPLIIVDAQNVAMKHGKNKVFSVKGIQIAIEFWTKNGHPVVGFLPEFLFNYEQVAQRKRMQQMNIKDAKASQIPDNMALLHILANKKFLIKTPSQDYDDSYCIQYAKQRPGAVIVTNDKFKDFVEKQEGKAEKKKEKKWVQEHSVSFTFHEDEFLPNPDASLFNFFSLKDYKHFPLDQLQ